MKLIEKESFEGERSLFQSHDLHLKECTFLEGESPLKESSSLLVENCTFLWKYPFWYGKDFEVWECLFKNEAHAGIWYTKDSSFRSCRFEEGKNFRHAENIELDSCLFLKATETFWWCHKIHGKRLHIEGDYAFMQSEDIELEDTEILGNYPFDGSKRVRLRNSRLHSKDAFWNSEEITLIDCELDGEYFGWNSKKVTLINCVIKSHQGFCYMDQVTLKGCHFLEGDLTFEYVSNADVDVVEGSLDIKHPISGRFLAPSYKEILLDDPRVEKGKLVFETKEK